MDVTFPENKGDKIWFYNKDEEDTASAKKLIIDGNGVAAEVIEQVGHPSKWNVVLSSCPIRSELYDIDLGHRRH